MSNSAKPNFVSENSARTVIFCGFATLLGIALILSNIDQSTSSRILAGILLGALLLALGAGMISIAIIGPKSKLQITWKQFARQSLDMALMFFTLPMLMCACLWVGVSTVPYLASPFFDEQLSGILGFQFGWFAVLATMPYWLFVWPILNRAKRSGAKNAFLLALKLRWIVFGLVVYSIGVAWVGPTLAFFLVSCLSSLCFCAIYHWILWPRFPRFTTELLCPQPENS